MNAKATDPTKGDHPVSAFDDIFAGEGNEDIRAAFAGFEKDFSDVEKLSRDTYDVAAPSDPGDTIGATSPDGTLFAIGYREQFEGNAAYICVRVGRETVWMPVSHAEDLVAWLTSRIAKAKERGRGL